MSSRPAHADAVHAAARVAGGTHAAEGRSEFEVLGVSFREAPVAVREALAFNPGEASAFLRDVAADRPDLEVLLLSTCNRSEFYLVADEHASAATYLLRRLRRLRPLAGILHAEYYRYRLAGPAAVRHLLRVACGLESAILGDGQILGQVKDALRIAAGSGTLGRHLEQAAAHAIRAAKRARTETRIGRGAASLGSVIAELIEERYARDGTTRHRARVLLIGAGCIAADVARHVGGSDRCALTIVNRTPDRAAALARHCNGVASHWERLGDLVSGADVVVAATAAPRPIVTRDLCGHFRARQHAPLYIDAGVPRNVALHVPFDVVDIDSLRTRQNRALEERRSAIPAVERIIAETMTHWEAWLAARPVEAALKALFRDVAAASRAAAAAEDAAEVRSLRRSLHAYARYVRRVRAGTGPTTVSLRSL
jgi:glutamyl-tRNA reductase